MSRFSRKQYCLEIGVHGCTLSLRGKDGWSLLDGSSAAPITDLGAEALRAFMLARIPAGAQVRTVFDDSLARFFVVRPPAQVATLHALRAIAALRFSALFGYAKQDWVLEGEWSATSPFFVCALPRALVEHVRLALASCKFVSLGMFPDSVWRWNDGAARMGDNAAWFCHVSAHHTLLAATQAGRIIAVSAASGPAPATLEQLQVALLRETLRWDLAYPRTVYCASAQMSAWHQQQCGEANIVAIADAAKTPLADTRLPDVRSAPAKRSAA